jgi:uncharacterized cupin superfamily protein
MISSMSRANVFRDSYELDESDPEGYRSATARVGRSAGGVDLSVNAFEIPPGQSVCPYHYEYEEEWLLVLEGDVRLRTPEGEEDLAKGDLVCFSKGPAGAHKVGNAGERTARVLMFSSAHEPAVAVYPDSDKIGVWSGNEQDKAMLRRADGNVGYYDGER